MNFKPLVGYLRDAFSDNGTPSSSRLLTLLHSAAAVFAMLFYTVKTHLLPDATTLGGLGVFSTTHYLINRVSTAWGKNDPQGNPPPPAPNIVVPPVVTTGAPTTTTTVTTS